MRHIGILTLFPALFTEGPLNISIFKRGLDNNIWKLYIEDLREHGIGKHQVVDDKPMGGGSGMVLRPDVVDAGLKNLTEKIKKESNDISIRYLYLSPRGQEMNQETLQKWATNEKDAFIFLCGRYEGVDQRVLTQWSMEEICVGSFVVAGGEVPCLMILEGLIRLIPGIVHDPYSLVEETFQEDSVEYDLYTQPRLWKEYPVPDVLLSGNHGLIKKFRSEQKIHNTKKSDKKNKKTT
jgi:tRNA (guanine37-N1)-methyltransferase